MQFSTLGEAKAEKVKMITMRADGWHYKIQKFVFGDVVAANPTSIKNLCPYFWMLSLALLFAPFKAIYNVLKYPVKQMALGLIYAIQPSEENWFESSDFSIYLWLDGWDNDLKIPLELKEKYGNSSNIINVFLKEKFGSIPKTMDAKQKTKFAEWKMNMEARRVAAREKVDEMNRIKEIKKDKRKAAVVRRMTYLDKIGMTISTLFKWVGKGLSFKTPDAIVRFSKRLFGGIISIFLFLAYFLVVSLLGQLTMLSIGAFNLAVFLNVLMWIGIVILGILVAFGIALLIKSFADYLNARVESPWYIKAILAVVNAIVWIVTTFIWLPVYFIFVSILWNFVAVSFIWGAMKTFGRMTLAISGVFGEYFAASYSDYCPGIEWVDEKGSEMKN